MTARKRFLLIVDPQRVFAAPDSPWQVPGFASAWQRIAQLAPEFVGRTVVTRWLPTTDRSGSWGPYFKQWEFADRPHSDPLFELVPQAAQLVSQGGAVTIESHKFGKWVPQLERVLAAAGPGPVELVVTGVATDCCVVSTVLPALDDGCYVTVVTDAVAGSSPENEAAALQLLGLYAPMVRLVASAELLAELGQ